MMEYLQALPTGMLSGAISVLAAFVIALIFKVKIGEGTKMGMNFETDLKCPKCKNKLPVFRMPTSWQQLLWGGWTCKNCKAKLDKWLTPINEEKE